MEGHIMGLKGAVYDPPSPGTPDVAVVINDSDGQVVTARSVPSPEAGEALIATVFQQFDADRKAGKI
jgi:hypothetical protein